MKLLSHVPKMLLLLFCLGAIYLWFSHSYQIVLKQFSYGFDAQNAALWQWTAQKGNLPYRDVFYPYGNLLYFQHVSLLAHMIVILLSAASLFIVLHAFWSFRLSLSHFMWSSISFFIFFYRFMGAETWVRYGIPIAAALLFSRFQLKTKLSLHIFVGMCIGLLFGLMPDQSVYVAFMWLFITFFTWITSVRLTLRSCWRKMCVPTVLFSLGSLLGVFPFTVYLYKGKMIGDFLYHLGYIGDIGLAAKTPFIPFAFSPSNVFSFTIVLLAICLISFVVIVLKKKPTLLHLCIASLSFLIVILEQKSILRSIDWQIAGIAFLLLLFLASWEGNRFIWRSNKVKAVTLLCMFGVLFFYPFRIVQGENLVQHEDPQPYNDVLNRLHQLSDFNDKIFSYPSNPIFYKLTNQDPPYFFTSYETTPATAQEKITSYIKAQDIRYLIYDLRVSAVQDGVPHYARNSHELAYLLTNFQALEKIGPFLVLRRSNHVDMNKICEITPENVLCSWQSRIDLGAIPLSEGLYKEQYVHEKKTYLSISQLNEELKHNSQDTTGIFVLLHMKKTKSDQLEHITLVTDEGDKEEISFRSCSSCILHVDRFPLFYQPRKLKSVEMNNDDLVDVSLFFSSDARFW